MSEAYEINYPDVEVKKVQAQPLSMLPQIWSFRISRCQKWKSARFSRNGGERASPRPRKHMKK